MTFKVVVVKVKYFKFDNNIWLDNYIKEFCIDNISKLNFIINIKYLTLSTNMILFFYESAHLLAN